MPRAKRTIAVRPALAELPANATPGMRLRHARERAGLSLTDVSGLTCITERLLTALEGDDDAAFLRPVYAVGFARNYARALGLDPGIGDEVRDRATQAAQLSAAQVPDGGAVLRWPWARLRAAEGRGGLR